MIISICAILSFFAVGIADNTGPTTTVRTTTGPTTVRTTIGLTNFMKTSTFKTTRGPCYGINESYQFDHGDCDPPCENPQMICKGNVNGCFCNLGYVRYNGVCIKPVDCPKPYICKGVNELYKTGQTNCTPTCNEPNRVCAVIAIIDGCFCIPGYVRYNGICIKLEDCPKEQPPYQPCYGQNESYQTNHKNCDSTCDRPFKICETDGVQNACFCNPGYVRHNGVCIHLDDCPPVVCKGEDEVFQKCGCDGTCDNQHPRCRECIYGCFCRAGYVRDNNGICISRNECAYSKKSSDPPQVCNGPNEIWRTNFGCDPTCQEPDKKCYDRKDGCFCIDGYVRDQNNECIKEEECIKLNCKKYEVENWCPERCSFENTCNYLISGIKPPCLPPDEPYTCTPRCDCEKRRVRIDGVCKKPSACCGQKERLVVCPANCDGTVKDGPPKPNCQLRPCNIFGCRCKYGLVRDDNNVCV